MYTNPFSSKGGFVSARVFTACILMVSVLAASVAHAASMVWSQVDEAAINVYYSPDGQRVIPITSTGLNVTPNLYQAGNSTWVTWVDQSGPDVSRLRVTRLSASGAVMETASLPTQNASIFSPSISVDPSASRVWLVWVEYNGQRENLFASYRDIEGEQRGNWKAPLQITPDSEYSANLPTITSSLTDRIEVNWMRTSADSSESATAQVLATNWMSQAATFPKNQANEPGVRKKYQSLHVSNKKGLDTYIKQLNAGQALSVDEQQWKYLTRNKDVIMGAIQSDSGASRRVVEEFK